MIMVDRDACPEESSRGLRGEGASLLREKRSVDMGIEIYYFSGTGNSLHVAQELQRRIPGTTLEPIIRALQRDTLTTHAETIGVVFPIHAFDVPWPVQQFLQRVDMSSASYIFALATRYCSSAVFSRIDRLLAQHGQSLAAYFSVEMPENYLPMFEMSSPEENVRMENAMQQRLDAIHAIISSKRISREKDEMIVFLLYHTLFPLIRWVYQTTRYFALEKAFYADSRCTGCGVCERVCLSEKIRLTDHRPEWQEKIPCTFCFACLHYCPVQAIQLNKRKTLTRGRYHHADVSADDIAGQKS